MSPRGALYSIIAFILVDVLAVLLFFAFAKVYRLFSAPDVPAGIEVEEASEAHARARREAGHESVSNDDRIQPANAVTRGEISLHMDKYSMVLQEENMLRRHHEQSASEADSVHEDTRVVGALPVLEVENGPLSGCTAGVIGPYDTGTPEHTHILVPYPGHERDNQSDLNQRVVPIFCAICLAEFAASETISWASNSECTHVFHRKCISGWFVRLLKTRKGTKREDTCSSAGLQCPMCRQDFLQLTRGEENV